MIQENACTFLQRFTLLGHLQALHYRFFILLYLQ